MIDAAALTSEERERLLNEIYADMERTSLASALTPKENSNTESEETQ